MPRGAASSSEVAQWAAAHAAVEPFVAAIGLHSAFSNPVFIALVVLLGISTAMCAWRRTKVALHRSRRLRDAARMGASSVVETHDIEVPLAPGMSAAGALSATAETLRHVGVKATHRDDVLVAVSPRWTVWGSAIFHWALLGLILAVLAGQALRSEGLMGIATGQTKADAPASYGVLHPGPLHDWSRVHRAIRVDSFDPAYRSGGVDRGPTPTVSLLDGNGKVVVTQKVYPNHTLKSGSLTLSPSSFGLAAAVSVVDTSGAALGRGVQLIEFSNEAPEGTVANGYVDIYDVAKRPVYRAQLTVPLLRHKSGWLQQIPPTAMVHAVVVAPDGRTVADKTLKTGEALTVPGTLGLRLDGIVYYARLQVVDDFTTPLLYAGMFVALIGLSIATLARQQIVLAAVDDRPEGPRVVARVLLWRNSSSSRGEIVDELTRALGAGEKGTPS